MYPDAKRVGTSSTRSGPAACSAIAPASEAASKMRTPSTSPTRAAYSRARPSAVQIPLLEGISAACASGELKSMSGTLRPNARFISDSGSVNAATSGRNCSGIWSSGISATSAPGGSSMTIRLTRPRSAAGSPI
jgi:hypothetical protein